jgi:hypothetical protein
MRAWAGLGTGVAVGLVIDAAVHDPAPAIAFGTAVAIGVWLNAWDLIVRRPS